MTKKMIPEMFRLDPVAAENDFGLRHLFSGWLKFTESTVHHAHKELLSFS
jgi:hypothetical protein